MKSWHRMKKSNRLPEYIASIAFSNMIMPIAFAVAASIMRVLPVSRSIAR